MMIHFAVKVSHINWRISVKARICCGSLSRSPPTTKPNPESRAATVIFETGSRLR
jgi:hypothetical protein